MPNLHHFGPMLSAGVLTSSWGNWWLFAVLLHPFFPFQNAQSRAFWVFWWVARCQNIASLWAIHKHCCNTMNESYSSAMAPDWQERCAYARCHWVQVWGSHPIVLLWFGAGNQAFAHRNVWTFKFLWVWIENGKPDRNALKRSDVCRHWCLWNIQTS